MALMRYAAKLATDILLPHIGGEANSLRIPCEGAKRYWWTNSWRSNDVVEDCERQARDTPKPNVVCDEEGAVMKEGSCGVDGVRRL